MRDPTSFARQWIQSWNAKDVEAVLTAYADDVVFTSPTAAKIVPRSGGLISGKDDLRDYWIRALQGNPDLEFTLVAVYGGIDTVVINYRNQHELLIAEVMTFRGDLVAVGHATHLKA